MRPSGETITISLRDERDLDHKLTPEYLEYTISPYLSALAEFQQVLDEIDGRASREAVITSIHQGSVTVSLGAELIEAVRDIIRFFNKKKRRHIEKMDWYEEQGKKYDLEKARTELLDRNAQRLLQGIERDRKLAEVEKLRQEAEKLRLENEKARLDLERERWAYTREVVRELRPHLAEEQARQYVEKLQPVVTVIEASPLTIELHSQ